jgi:hypothetical protein
MKCAFTNIRDYLFEWWNLNVSRSTLTRWFNDAMEGLGIVQWWGKVADGKKPRHWAINVPALLLLAEACERRIIADAKMKGASHGEEMDALPKHQGFTLKLLYDAIFPGFGWHRDGDPEDPEPTTYAETDAMRLPRQPIPEPLKKGIAELSDKFARYGEESWLLQESRSLLARWHDWKGAIAAAGFR